MIPQIVRMWCYHCEKNQPAFKHMVGVPQPGWEYQCATCGETIGVEPR